MLPKYRDHDGGSLIRLASHNLGDWPCRAFWLANDFVSVLGELLLFKRLAKLTSRASLLVAAINLLESVETELYSRLFTSHTLPGRCLMVRMY